MATSVIPTIKVTTNPTSSNTVDAGYPLGQHWFNTTTGEEFVHKTDGFWLSRNIFGNETNNITIDANGTLRLNGTATVWEDINFPIIVRTTGAGIPSLATFNGNIQMPQWAVNDYNQMESNEFVHAWKEGSRVYWHLHLDTNGTDTTDRYVKFELEFAYSANGAWQFPAVVTTPDILIPANTPDRTQIIMSLHNFIPTGSKIGDHIICRLKRVAATGTAPTGNPFIPMVQLHIEKDSFGSNEIGTKE